MFDIHTHILPAIDDGPLVLEDSIRTVLALLDEGVTGIVATPHFGEEYPRVPAEEVQRRVRALQRVLRKGSVTIEMWAGHEVVFDEMAEEALINGVAATINDGPYVLLQLPRNALPAAFPDLIQSMRTKGFIPILANIESYRPVTRNPDAAIPLVEAGALAQITTGSLAGAMGAEVQRAAEALLRRNLAHLFASGSHNVRERLPYYLAGLRRAEELVGRTRMLEMSMEVPRAIVHGGMFSVPPILSEAEVRDTRNYWPYGDLG